MYGWILRKQDIYSYIQKNKKYKIKIALGLEMPEMECEGLSI
jgi:hypothetical protein